jgi:hypothetical protein
MGVSHTFAKKDSEVYGKLCRVLNRVHGEILKNVLTTFDAVLKDCFSQVFEVLQRLHGKILTKISGVC